MSGMTLQIGGMSCGHCVSAVRRALGATPGVEVEQVAVGTASVRYDPQATTPAAIVRAVEDAGYPVTATAA